MIQDWEIRLHLEYVAWLMKEHKITEAKVKQ